MKHLIDIKDIKKEDIENILQLAKSYKQNPTQSNMSGKNIITLFFENSTRTKTSFDIATQKLNAKITHVDIANSSIKKGESLIDTVQTISAMKPDIIIVRHEENGVPRMLTNYTDASIINAGDGSNQHPTQALIDLFTLLEIFEGDIKNKKIAIVGDIKNSRVANSNIDLLTMFGVELILIAPEEFLPDTNIKTSNNIEDTRNTDAIIRLRTQTERHSIANELYLKEYAVKFCINKELLDNREIYILHPGPVHRNVDISDEILLDKRSKVLTQVENSIYVRMAIINYFLEI